MNSVIVNTKSVGYKGQDKTRVDYTFRIDTVANDFAVDLLGDTKDVVVFESFKVEGLAILTKNFINEGLEPKDAEEMTLKHLKGLVTDSILVFSEYQKQSIGCIVQKVK